MLDIEDPRVQKILADNLPSAAAKLLGCTTLQARKARSQLCIHTPRSLEIDVNCAAVREALALSKEKAAEILGCSGPTISRLRKVAGIEGPSTKVDIPAHVRPLLGTCPDTVLAKEHNLPATSVRRERIAAGIPAYSLSAELAKNLDETVLASPANQAAAHAGVSPTTMLHLKAAAGIKTRARAAPVTGNLPQSFFDELGVRSDAELARHYNVPRPTVSYTRRRLGIAAAVPGPIDAEAVSH